MFPANDDGVNRDNQNGISPTMMLPETLKSEIDEEEEDFDMSVQVNEFSSSLRVSQ